MKPYGDRVIIEASEPEKTSAGGLIIPDLGKEKALPGIVVAVGPGMYTNEGKLISCTTQPGDTVIYPKFGCHTIEIDGKEYLIIKESDLLVNLTK